MLVVLSKFTVAGGIEMIEAVKQAYVNRPHQVDGVPGFVRLDVISPLEQKSEIWLLTYWETESSFRQWYGTHHYHAVHEAIPSGLKLVPHSTDIQFFEHVGS